MRACGRPDAGVIYCHCRDCRRASGPPVSICAGYGAEQGRPNVYESSPCVRRSICDDCGTPLSYEDERLPGEVYLMVGAFADPEPFEPEAHDWISQKRSGSV